jgi:hypothetical protein
MGSVRLLVLGCALLLLAACGGGGGGGGDRSTGNFTIASTAVTFDGDPGGAVPQAAVVTGSITGVNQDVFLFVALTNNGIANATVEVTGTTTGRLTIFPKHPAVLGFGTYNDTVTVRACLDAGCNQQISGSPKVITVTYNVRGLSVDPTSVTLSATEGSAPVAQQVTLSNNTTLSWTSAIVYQGATTGWLTLSSTSPATQGPQQLTFTANALNTPGSYTANVQITAGNRQLSIPVTYNVTPNLVLSQSSIGLTAVTGQTAPPSANNVFVEAATGATTFTTSVTYGAGASNWLEPLGTAAPGPLSLVPQTVALPPGSYEATVTLTPNGAGSPVSLAVTYTLAPSALTVTPGGPSFEVVATTTNIAPFMERGLLSGDTGAPLTWTASDNSPWLEVTPAGSSGDVVTLNLVPAEFEAMPNGQHQAIVTFTYNGPSVVNHTLQLGVDLTLHLPTIEHAMPHVAYLNEGQEQLVLHGSGFAQPGGEAVQFEGVDAAFVQVVSDTEIRVVPSAVTVQSLGSPTIAIANGLNLDRSEAELVVRAKPNYGSLQFDSNHGLPSRVVYEPERDLVFGVRHGLLDPPLATLDHVLRFELDPTGAAAPAFSAHSFAGLWDIALSPDGNTLYVLTQGQLRFVDTGTMTETRSPVSVSEFARLLTVFGDGRILFPNIPSIYSPRTNEFEPLDVSLGHGASAASADGSRVGVESIQGNGKVLLGAYDAGAGEFRFQSEERFSSRMSLDRLGTRIAHAGEVFNADDLTLYGSVDGPDGEFSVLSPTGDRLYAITFSPTSRVHVWDTSAAATPFPELTPIDVPFGAASYAISLNGEHLFIIDAGHLFVVEL